jgi:hypothetical protein
MLYLSSGLRRRIGAPASVLIAADAGLREPAKEHGS